MMLSFLSWYHSVSHPGPMNVIIHEVIVSFKGCNKKHLPVNVRDKPGGRIREALHILVRGI